MFDSGVGGQSVANYLALKFPKSHIRVINDRANVPYGSKTDSEIIRLTESAITPLINSYADIIIIACNTATAAAIDYLRAKYPTQLFIGLEPMVKPAAKITKTGVIAVYATPSTLKSPRYKKLISDYAKGITILEPDCRDWASMVENDSVDYQSIKKTTQQCLAKGADTIVLACTHYHWLKKFITETAYDKAIILEPSEAIARRIEYLCRNKNTTA